MKIRFRRGNKLPYIQAGHNHVGIPSGVTFEAMSLGTAGVMLRADSFGSIRASENYGNGPLCTRSRHVRQRLGIVQETPNV